LAIRVSLLKLGGSRVANELGVESLHVVRNFICHLLIESSQEDRSDHHSSIVTKSSQETGALKSDIGGTNDESLTRGLLKGEHIITCDTEFLVAGDAGVRWATTSGNHEVLGSNLLNFFSIIELNGVFVDEGSVGIVIFDHRHTQLSLVSHVESLNVFLNFPDHLGPGVFLLLVNFPSLEVLISTCFSEESSVMHHLLGDATHIDTSST
jgi:hypothetical protein